MTKKMTWRLANRPTSNEVSDLFTMGLITKEEARAILFTEKEEKEVETEKSLEAEIKFLREIVEKLSEGKTTRIVEIIKTVQTPYWQQQWYHPYATWCGISPLVATSGFATVTGSTSLSNQAVALNNSADTTKAFSSIKTF